MVQLTKSTVIESDTVDEIVKCGELSIKAGAKIRETLKQAGEGSQ